MYLYCVELHMPEESFWGSTMRKVFSLIEFHLRIKYGAGGSADIPVTSMKQIPGW